MGGKKSDNYRNFKQKCVNTYLLLRENARTIIEALERAGINSEKIAIYDTDGEWQNGYMIHYEKDGTVKFKSVAAYQNNEEHIGFSWWNNPDISEQ